MGFIELVAMAIVAAFRAFVRSLNWFRSPRSNQQPSKMSPAQSTTVANKHRAANDDTELSDPSTNSAAQGTKDYDTAVARIAALLPYRGTRRVLTDGELAFWHPLRQAVGDRHLIFCKVRLADLAAAPDQRADSRRRFQDINAFHVDFVLCDLHTTAPLLVIELDDRSHTAQRGRNRDRFKDAVLKAAGLPIYRVKCRQAYSPIELSNQIARRIPARGR